MKDPKSVDFEIVDDKAEPPRLKPGQKSVFGEQAADGKETYDGPERRTGPRDRRSGQDRRGAVRMGEDRRKNRGRRDYDQDVWDLQNKD